METWGDLFTPRQALALSTFVRLVREAHKEVLRETGDAGFARGVTTCLAVAVSDLSHNSCSTSYYIPDFFIHSAFQGSGFPMKGDFIEMQPCNTELRGLIFHLGRVVAFLGIEQALHRKVGTVRQGSATATPLPDQSVPYVITDPPYYDAVPYASLSDFCYVWLRRMLYDVHPELFHAPLTPKAEECIMDPGPPPPGEPEKTKEFFETTLEQALSECRRVLRPDGVAVVLFAHKGTAGWEALLNALVRAGWSATGCWPIETERGARMRAKNSAVLASSVFLVCRARLENAGVGDWRQVLEEMNRKVAAWLPRLEKEGIHGADAIFSCIGPALEVYSRYESVETAGGQMIPLGDVRNGNGKIIKRGYLSYVWEAVAREALKDFPTDEPDARVTGFWLWTLRDRVNGVVAEASDDTVSENEGEEKAKKKLSGYALPYDDARLIIQGLGAHEDELRRPGGILEVKANTARLLAVDERRRFLFGEASKGEETSHRRRRGQASLFEEQGIDPEPEVVPASDATTLDRLHQAMLLFADGRSEALRRFSVDEGVGRDMRFWRLADALSRLYPMNSQEKRWVDGLLAKKKGLGL
jgi:SAM-dependent methyltransferase